MKYLYTISLCLIFTFLGSFNITNAQTCGNTSCLSPKVCVSVDGATKCLDNQANSSGVCQGDSSIRCDSNQACVSNQAREIVCATKVTSNSLSPAPTTVGGSTPRCVPNGKIVSNGKCGNSTCNNTQVCINRVNNSSTCVANASSNGKCGNSTCNNTQVCAVASATADVYECRDGQACKVSSQPNPSTPAGNTPAGSTSGGSGDASSAGSTNNSGSLKDGLQEFGSAGSGLNTSGTLISYVANIIRWILGILGTVFFVIVVIQGYIYMTAGGDSGKTATAAGAIGNAVVGLLIIMGAFLITNFVTSGLLASG